MTAIERLMKNDKELTNLYEEWKSLGEKREQYQEKTMLLSVIPIVIAFPLFAVTSYLFLANEGKWEISTVIMGSISVLLFAVFFISFTAFPFVDSRICSTRSKITQQLNEKVLEKFKKDLKSNYNANLVSLDVQPSFEKYQTEERYEIELDDKRHFIVKVDYSEDGQIRVERLREKEYLELNKQADLNHKTKQENFDVITELKNV